LLCSEERASDHASDLPRNSHNGIHRCLQLTTCRRNPSADLLHKRQKIADTPMVDDLAVAHPHRVDAFKMNLAVSWGDAKKWPFMRAVVRLVCRHPVTIGELLVNLRMKVGECGTNIAIELTHSRFVGS